MNWGKILGRARAWVCIANPAQAMPCASTDALGGACLREKRRDALISASLQKAGGYGGWSSRNRYPHEAAAKAYALALPAWSSSQRLYSSICQRRVAAICAAIAMTASTMYIIDQNGESFRTL